ncbi:MULTISPECIES: hypothetical protein [unclassified Pseudoalteromonas]|uniref:hypothetical protein n=1 Tax=unclassified Pseudoalteromonas TaxID=194690 RepID=UPI001600A9E4|nr:MULTISPECIES: hypothetical protein [unclassified Pseudoalteromonas]MBB1301437.1 hypothetical protein [Pseudoalteromonas sp. SR44-8]MBB1311456.1 hypothetical protein [Pseudoalteromonas sp. SR41-8]MBB1397184.1 hypothetical protein [Pseudoalteromonas sp. SG44-8]MBB1408273.1 hypothetical protein [Pseudoalteromonas sp. SG44-17]MBB1482056.1 hypothetical protein [Pseudoalteromonas sp. SG41-2]
MQNLQRDNHWIQFHGSDGRSYVYYWGEQVMPDEQANMFFNVINNISHISLSF